MNVRTEHDLLGPREIPQDVYWGIHTLRAQENFAFGGQAVIPSLIKAIAFVKKACCKANEELGYLTPSIAQAIIGACDDVIAGKLSDHFPLAALQGGAGTSTNMNVNEVIANRALELLGKKFGEYSLIHPLDHVNLHQSTNDVYPTALKIAAIFGMRELSAQAAVVQGALQRKEQEFSAVLTMGRTEMQNAVPMTLGSQFASFAEAIGRDRWRLSKGEERLRVVNIGGTAIGTGLAAPKSYIFLVAEKLREITGLGLSRPENPMDATANTDAFVEVAGMLAAHAATMQKIGNDLRLLQMLGDINLKPVQAGSSIMPGKINPVICEAIISAAIKVKANIAIINETASMGTLQLNEFLPLLGHAFLESVELLKNADRSISKHCAEVTANSAACMLHVMQSPTIITAFLPDIGYEAAQNMVAAFAKTGESDFKAFLENKLGKNYVDSVLSPERIMELGFSGDRSVFKNIHRP